MSEPTLATLDDLTGRLERAAGRLRTGDLTPDDAAALVEECAGLAGQASAELDRQARAAADAGVAQASLLSAQDPLL